MRRASLATLLAAASCGALIAGPPPARALPVGYGRGRDYCELYGSYASPFSFEDVYACASVRSPGNLPFDADGDWSFQCVELSARFLWAIYGIWAGPGTGVDAGGQLVGIVHGRYPRVPVGSPSPSRVPVAGDVISLGPGGGVDRRFGHTAVVVSDDQRRGHFRIISQNFPPGQASEERVYVDLSGRHNGRVLINGAWTVASWLELRPQPARKPRRSRHRRR